MVSCCEALVYGHKAGLKLDQMIGLLSKGAAGSFTLSNWIPKAIKRDFSPGFYVEHFVKDLNICLEESRRMNIGLPGLALAAQLYNSLMNIEGGPRMGTQGLLLALEQMNGMKCDSYA